MHWLVTLLRKKSRDQNQALGERLRQARESAQMTQTQAASHVGRDQTFITRIESGLQQATFVEVEQLAQAYGKPLTYFQTISQIEQSNRNCAIRSDTLAAYTEVLLQKQRRSQEKSRHSAGRRQ
jgi:transcriptional regulator with XRE-family HTH domain